MNKSALISFIEGLESDNKISYNEESVINLRSGGIGRDTNTRECANEKGDGCLPVNRKCQNDKEEMCQHRENYSCVNTGYTSCNFSDNYECRNRKK